MEVMYKTNSVPDINAKQNKLKRRDSVKAPRIRGAPEKGAKKQPREQVNFRGRRQSVGNS